MVRTIDRSTASLDRRDWQLAFALALVCLIVQLPTLLVSPPEAKAINNALRILDGEMPYRDFWTMYAPGHFYLIAILFKLFGTHAWIPGIAKLALVAANGALLFTLLRRVGLARWPSSLATVGFIGMRVGFGPTITTYETAMLFLLPAVDRAIAFAQGHQPSSLMVAGILCGVGAWFKHDIAAYVAAGIVFGLSLSWFIAGGRRPDHWVPPMGIFWRVGSGAVLAVLPVAAFLAVKAAPDAWHDLIVFPATDFRVVRGEGYPSLLPSWQVIGRWFTDPSDLVATYQAGRHLADWIAAGLPQGVFAIGAVLLVVRRRTLPPDAVAVLSIGLASMPFFWLSARVQHNTNFWSLWMFSVLLGAIVWTKANLSRRNRAVLTTVFAIYTAALIVEPVLEAARTAYSARPYVVMDFPTVAGIRMPRARSRVIHPIVSFIRAHVPESEPIYAGLVRHDAVVISNQNFYYYAERRVASRYNELHPGVVDRPDAQREIISDLKRLNVRCVVLWDFGWPKPYMDALLDERRRQIPDIGATVLDEFIASHFQVVGRYGEFLLLWRKDLPMPQPLLGNGSR